MDMAVTSMMVCSSTLTAMDSGRSREPLHWGQGRLVMKSAMVSRDQLESVSRKRRSRLGMTPSKTRLVSYDRLALE